MNNFEQLRRWFLSQCDGDWEHGYGPKISSNEQGGWTLTVDLEDTDWEETSFTKEALMETDGGGWVKAETADHMFIGTSDALHLADLVGTFLESLGNWPEEKGLLNRSLETGLDEQFQEISRWYLSHCDGEWERSPRIKVTTMDDPGWLLNVDYKGTELERRVFRVNCSLPFAWSQTDKEWEGYAVQWNEENVPWSQDRPIYLHAKAERFVFTAWGDHSQLGNLIRLFMQFVNSELPTQ